MSSSFTSEGILVGTVEYGTYSAVARLIIVAFVSNIALRFVYARRIGIYLVAELSIGAGLQAWFRQTVAQGRPARRIGACLLFLFALFVTRGLDVVVSTIMASRKGSYTQRYAYVSTADLSSCPKVAGILEGVVVNRSGVYAALVDITKQATDEFRHLSLWPEVIGTLSDAETAAVTLPINRCPVIPMTPPYHPFQMRVPLTTVPGIAMTKGKSFSLFGKNILLLEFSLQRGARGQCDELCSILIPISVGFVKGHIGQNALTTQTHRHFGVLISRDGDFVAYDTECGLAPENVTEWLTAHKPVPHVRGTSTLWYFDEHSLLASEGVQGTAAFFLMHSNDFTKEFDVLSFGGHISQLTSGTRTRVFTRLTSPTIFPHMDQNNIFTGKATVPLDKQPTLSCNSTAQLFHTSGQLKTEIEMTGNPSSFNGGTKPMRQCVIDFGPVPPQGGQLFDISKQNFDLSSLSNNATFFYDPAHRGTQICRTKVVRYLNSNSAKSRPSDLFAAIQFKNGPDQPGKAPLNINCMPRDASGSPKIPKPAFAIVGDNFQSGYLTDSGLDNFNKTANVDPNSGQAIFFTLVLIPWWEVCIIATMTVFLTALGVWGDIAVIVVITMYSYAFRPLPHVVQHREQSRHEQDQGESDQDSKLQRRVHLADGFTSVPLMDATQRAAVQLDGP